MPVVRIRRIIDDAGAEAVIAAAEKVANENGYRVVFAVVDPWGEVIQLRRTQNAQIASSRVAVDKARTAAIFVRPSRVMEEQVTNGRLGALALHGVSALTGGIPLVVDGEVIGAIGTSGETPDQDEACSIAGAAAEFSTVEVPAITFEAAKLAADAVAEVSEERGVSPVAAVVDAGGALVYLWRPDGAQVASAEVSVDKARTAAIYRRPSKDFEDQASGGRPSALHLARAVPLQGGMPIIVDGHVIGAIGVSGATSAPEDQELAAIGAAAASVVTRTDTRATSRSRRSPRSSRRVACSSRRTATSSTPAVATRRARSSTTSASSTSCTSSRARPRWSPVGRWWMRARSPQGSCARGRSMAARRPSWPRATSSPSPTASHISSSRSPTHSSTSS